MEARRLTTAVANAIAITLDEKARAAYQQRAAREDALEAAATRVASPEAPAPEQSPAEYRATLERLGAMKIGRGPTLARSGAVKVH
jgi:hypothetical protein